ncbi:hypothetical protein Peur_014307 [Populus x canadensis]
MLSWSCTWFQCLLRISAQFEVIKRIQPVVLQELRMYNFEYLERPDVVVLSKIDLPEARNRFPSLTEEISRIGCDEVPSEPKMVLKDAVHSLSTDDGSTDKLCLLR